MRRREAGRGAAPAGLIRNESLGRHRGSARVHYEALPSGETNDSVPIRLDEGESVGDVRFSCGDGEWGTGVYGRAGALIDQLGLQCAKIPEEPFIPGGAAAGGKIITKIPGAPGDIIAALAPPPPPPAEIPCTIKRPSDIYNLPGGPGATVIATLAAPTPGVTLIERKGTDWFHLRWAAMQGWGFSGEGYDDAISCP